MSKLEKALQKAVEQRRATYPSHYSGTGGHQGSGDGSGQSPVYTHTMVQPTMSIELLDRERLLGGGQEDELQDTINMLRTQVLQKTRSMGWSTILVTSPNPKAGKTTIAANLAISLSRELNHTALLVDTYLSKPTIAGRLGISEGAGLSDYLMNQAPMETLLINPGLEKLVVLPAGTATSNSAELLGSSTMKRLVSELKHRYVDRYIILDSPHIMGMPDAMIVAEYVDAVLLVVSDSETTTDDLQKTLQLLGNRNILGIVLNKAR